MNSDNEEYESSESDNETLDESTLDDKNEPEKTSDESSSDDEDVKDEESDKESDDVKDVEDLLDEIIPEDEDEQPDDLDEEMVQENGDDEEVGVEEKYKSKKTATKSSKETKKRLFPFIQKKKRMIDAEERDDPEYYVLDVRETTKEFMLKNLNQEEKDVKTFEKAIYNAAVRYCKNYCSEGDVETVIFKKRYLDIVRYYIGAICKMDKKQILEEIRQDKYEYESFLLEEARKIEETEQAKIKNPMNVEENSLYPCPKCGGIKIFKRTVYDRSGDEGASLRLWCHNKSCGFSWRLTG